MGYQALLFCLDEKLARVVTQVFSELDFSVEKVNEPFTAVKKLMAQRYDAIVVDCDNEQNATLLFKSARNSTSNQSSLALALVEGQAGVAKAYRIGANLVLTKPINVEQAKGTLRVARGLLRKNVDAASPTASAGTSSASKLAPAPTGTPLKPVIQNVPPAAPAPSIYEPPQFESSLPAMAASTEVEESPIIAPAPKEQPEIFARAESQTKISDLFAAPVPPKPAPPTPAKATPTANFGITSGTAAAPAPAKEAPAPPEKKAVVSLPAEPAAIAPLTFGAGSSPTFAALDLDKDDSGGSGGSKKILVVAAVVLAAAALGYFGWTKFGATSSSSQPVSVPPKNLSAASTSPAPTAVSPAAPSAVPTEPPASTHSAVVTPQTTKPSATISASADITIGATTPAPKHEAAPIVVKSPSAAKKSQADDSAPQLPSALAMASPNDAKLTGLVSSVPSALPKVATSTLKISQGVSQGLVIKRVQPRYPQNALSMRIQGAVQLEATIDKEGRIANLKVVSGDPSLGRAAADAVHQWRYKPYYLNGEPVEIQTQITVNFKLPN